MGMGESQRGKILALVMAHTIIIPFSLDLVIRSAFKTEFILCSLRLYATSF